MKRSAYSIITILFLIVPVLLIAQTGYYETYDDYLNDNLLNMEGYSYKGAGHKMQKVYVKFENEAGEKWKVACTEVWGVKYLGNLFRNDQDEGETGMVMSTGKIVYYENGVAHLDMIKDKKTETKISPAYGYVCYLSKGINDKIFPMGFYNNGKYKKGLKKLRAEYPADASSLFDCIEKKYSVYKIKDCVKDFE